MKNPRLLFSKEVKKFVRLYNDDLPEIPWGIKDLQARMLLGSGWTKDKGPWPGIFDDGRSCLWACTWLCSHSAVNPRDYWPALSIPVEGLIYEMLNYVSLSTRLRPEGLGQGVDGKYLQFMIDLRNLEHGLGRVKSFMEKWQSKISSPLRQEFLCPWNLPDMSKIIDKTKFRPGYPSTYELPPIRMVPKPPKGMRVAR